ncbi:kat SU protein [Lasiosphaeria hispida]|uniref:Kat SU protein n=1 Tax=Lasiosphaeria hispida TaxID=260671 RepID=A0AAJ0M9Y8_9PEZI|nr:kat SU protein [Lasiosphaeria hispida]
MSRKQFAQLRVLFTDQHGSFLDKSSNTELIRWSDKGDSFVVLDEDEFAKTLIPELFKHNNYASFVRQLNMYGFHKRVGLSDNSMKASERKNKSPSEYYNPYFRRGHPNLLWLINKPKSSSSKKKGKKEDGDGESDDDGGAEEAYVAPSVAAAPVGRGPPAANDVGPLQKKDLVHVKGQIERLQQQQMAISNMLGKLRQEHSQLYSQALMFQDMHERHENSINAILNFLANVFRKSLEEQGGTQSVQDLLASIIPNAQAHSQAQMPQGSVVDLGDFVNRQAANVTAMGTPKRQQRLLPPIPQHQVGKANTISPASTPSPAPQSTYQGPQMGSVTELFDNSPADTSSPTFIKDELRTNPQEGMMKIIQDTNAVNTSGIDLPNVANKTSVTMSNDQRNKMLSIMAGQSNHGHANNNNSLNHSHNHPSAPSMNRMSATVNPSTSSSLPTPTMPAPTTTPGGGLSLSPVLSSIPPPPLHEYHATQAELDVLQQLQHDQASQINQLSSLLGPLSPLGRIPGLGGVDEQGNPTAGGGSGGYFDIDYDQFLNSNAFTDSGVGGYDGGGGYAGGGGIGGGAIGGGDGNDFNFSLDGGGEYMPVSTGSATGNNRGGFESGQVFETGSVADMSTPSEAGTEEITRNDLGLAMGSPERDPKRRRKA